MTATITTRSLASGWQATVHLGCEDVGGKLRTGTADRSVGFWGATKERAKRRAQEFPQEGSA